MSDAVSKAIEVLVPLLREASDLNYDEAKLAAAALVQLILDNGLSIVHTVTP